MAREGKRRFLRPCLRIAPIVAAVGLAAILASPEILRSTLSRASRAYSQGDWQKSSALARDRLRESPGDPEAMRLLARSAARLKDDKKARDLYGRLGGAAAMQAEDFFLLGSMIERQGEPESARLAWETGLRADQYHPELLNALAREYLRLGRYEQAGQLARQLAERPGWKARGQLLLGRILYEQGDAPSASAALRRGLELETTSDRADDPPRVFRTLLAKALLRLGKPAEAETQLRVLEQPTPDSETAWLALCAALQAGDWHRSKAASEAAVSYRSDHPTDPDPAPFVGASACARCHQEKYRTQQASLHARTFRRGDRLGSGSALLPKGALADPANPEVHHNIAARDGRIVYQTTNGKAVGRAEVEFAFGSGDRGLTLVGRDGHGMARELRLSHYADVAGWDVTSGHPARPPDWEGYLGRHLAPDDVFGCLKCHTTDPLSAREGRMPAAADRGIGCERCHGPGLNHLKAVDAKLPELGIGRPALATGPAIVALCAGCHSPSGDNRVRRNDPAAVRFQGTTLTWSRCYLESKGRFDCVTCHDPHRDAESSPAFYESKCLSCHASSAGRRHGDRKNVAAAVCPVDSNRHCLSCHMPRVKSGVPHSTFTDHYIRVHPRAGATDDSKAE